MYRTLKQTADIFIYEICSKPPKTNYTTKKLNIKSSVDIQSMDSLDLNDYDPKNKKECRYFFDSKRYFHQYWIDSFI